MSLFNRKVLQIGVVANLTLLQKYCILNIGNTLVAKSGDNMLSMFEAILTADMASSWLQFECILQYARICKFYAYAWQYDMLTSISANVMHIHICILCMCANCAYCNMRGIDEIANGENWTMSVTTKAGKKWQLLNSNKLKFWILKSNKIQIWIKIWIQTCM